MIYLEKKAVRLWQEAMRIMWCGRCGVCKAPGHAGHHIIPRDYLDAKFSLFNGIYLCTPCHNNVELLPDSYILGILNERYPYLYEWHITNKPIIMKSNTWHNTQFFKDSIDNLKGFIEQYEGHFDNILL